MMSLSPLRLLPRCLVVFAVSWAVIGQANPLPDSILASLKAQGIPADAVAAYVQRVGTNHVLASHNADVAMNPASVMKLPTTLAALELLGPAHTYRTDVLVTGALVGGKLDGDLYFRGGGDPKLNYERFWLLLKHLRERGIRSIHGDVVIDRSAYVAAPHDPAKFDGEPLKAHNVGPDPLLINLKAVRFFFTPRDNAVHIYAEPALLGIRIQNDVKLSTGVCGDWRDKLTRTVEQHADVITIRFSGNYAQACNEGTWNMSLYDGNGYALQIFRALWIEAGGLHKGGVRAGRVPTDARLVYSFYSPPLSDIVRDVNKFSNNVMARQVFLSLSASEPQGASAEASERMIKAWLRSRGIDAAQMVFENGSGLSRRERMSAKNTVEVLQWAWKSPVLGDFLASLPLVGSDGTMRKRAATDGGLGYAHIKGGTLTGVRAIAGYVLDKNGQRWAVALIVNHSNAANLQSVQDAFLHWVWAGDQKSPVSPRP